MSSYLKSSRKSSEFTYLDEGSDKQSIYETTTLQSINQIKTVINNRLYDDDEEEQPSFYMLKRHCVENLHEKYSKLNMNFMPEKVHPRLKRKRLNDYIEMVTWKKPFPNNIKK